MNCKQAQRLIGPHILGDLEPKSFDCLALEDHLQSCPACREEYAGFKEIIGFVQDNRAEFAQALKNLENQEASQTCASGIYAPSIAKKSPIIRFIIRVAAAACIIIGISVWLMLSYIKAPTELAGQVSASNQAPSIKIEQLTDNSAVIIPAERNIFTSDGQIMTLRINEKHRLIMNENTSLSINPLVADESIGCSVQLLNGEIYAHVQYDGNPFVVKTPNGNAVITGTTFDIQATEIETKLVVAEGTVRFESPVSSVEVSKGQLSRIFKKTTPTIPSLCDAAELTAWATGHELKSALAKIESVTGSFDLTDLWLSADSGAIEFEKLNYRDWIEGKRDWFGREFPHVFDLRQALAQAAIEADYPELLFTTGDIWQFAYPQVSNQQIPVISLDSLIKAGSRYGFNEQWLLDNIPSAKSLPDNPKQILTDKNAFTKWGELFKNLRSTNKAPDSDMLLNSLHAGTYLTNTRTLAWLYISNETTEISAEDKEQVLDLLQSQVNTANDLTNLVIRLFAESEKQPCEELYLLIEQINDSLTLLTDIEERVLEYEIGK